ncbi:MAG: hypothetical protein MdMp014T_0257 [Treponematales bacterium]
MALITLVWAIPYLPHVIVFFAPTDDILPFASMLFPSPWMFAFLLTVILLAGLLINGPLELGYAFCCLRPAQGEEAAPDAGSLWFYPSVTVSKADFYEALKRREAGKAETGTGAV